MRGAWALVLAASIFAGNALASTIEYTVTDLGTLGGDASTATGINDNGQVVGFSNVTPGALHKEAFLWSNGTMQGLGYFAGLPAYLNSSKAYGINAAGQVVGGSSGPGGGGAFVYSNGTMTDIGAFGANAINDSG